MTEDTGKKQLALVHWVLDHPKLAGFVAFIALAVGFTPKASMLGSWICLCIAAIFGVAMLIGVAEKKGWGKARKITCGLLFLVLIACFGVWLTNGKKSIEDWYHETARWLNLDDHSPKQQTVTANNSASQGVTVQAQGTSTQRTQSATTKSPSKKRTHKTTTEAPKQPIGVSASDQPYADTLAKFIEEGTEINQRFISSNNTGLLIQEEQAWSAKVQNDLEAHLGRSYAVQFKSAQGSAFMGCPEGRSVEGCGYWQEIRAMNDVLSRFITEARNKPAQTIIGVPGGVTTGNINQSAGSALSFNQQGGITAGTVNVNPPPNPPKVYWTLEDVTADNNLRNPKLYPSWSQGTPSESVQKKIAGWQQYATNPGVIITGHINESWPTANFAAECDHPCQSLSARLTDGPAWSEGYADGPGNVEILFFVQPASLAPGVHFKWEIHSKDSQPITVKDVTLVNLQYSGAN